MIYWILSFFLDTELIRDLIRFLSDLCNRFLVFLTTFLRAKSAGSFTAYKITYCIQSLVNKSKK